MNLSRCIRSGTFLYIEQASLSDIESWIHIIHILLIQLFPQELDCFTEALEVDNLPFPQEFDYIIYIRIVAEPEDIVIGGTCLLLWHAQSFATKLIRKFGNK